MPKLSETDLSAIDLRTLTPEGWQALKREVNRRAHAERAQVLRGVVTWLRSRWQGRKPRGAATPGHGTSHPERLFAGRA